jgi:Kelch motif protein
MTRSRSDQRRRRKPFTAALDRGREEFHMTLRALSLSLALLTLSTLPAVADPTGSWRMTADLDSRTDFTTTVLDTGEVLLVGGRVGRRSTTTSSCMLYDPLTDHWRSVASMPGARSDHAAIKLRSGKVLVAGGYLRTGYPSQAANQEAVLYDPAQDRWERLGRSSWGINGRASKPQMVLLADGRVFAMNDDTSRDARIFDPATKTWITDSPALTDWKRATSVHDAKITSLPDGRVFMAFTTGGQGYPFPGTAYVFDPSAARRMNRQGRVSYPHHLVTGLKGEVVGASRDDASLTLGNSSRRVGWLRYSVSQLERLPSGRIAAFNYASHTSTDGRRFEVNLLDLEESQPEWHKVGRRGGGLRWGHRYVVLKSGQIMLLGGEDSTYKPLPTYVLTISDEADRIKALQGAATSAGASSGITGALTPTTPAQPVAASKPKIDRARIEGGQLQIEGQGFAGSDVRVYLGRRRLRVSRQDDGGTKVVATLLAEAMTTSVRVRVDGRLSASVRLSQPSAAPKLSRAWRAGSVLVIEGSGLGSSVDDVRAFFGSRSLRVLWASPTRLLIERPSGRGRLQLDVKGLRSLSRTLR